MSLTTTSTTPPHIHTTIRELLNLFQKPIDGSGIQRKGLIFQDDKQIKYLSVRYHLNSGQPSINTRVIPFKSFLLDIELANNILNGVYDQYIDCYDFNRDIERFNKFSQDFFETNSADELRELKKNEDRYLKTLSKEAYDAMVHIYEIKRQEDILSLCGLSIKELSMMYHTPWSNDWLARSPIRIELPGIPTRKGETKLFKKKIRESLKKFRSEHNVLEPLHVPVILQAFYKPPEVSGGFYKDIDNIMLLILPIFNEVFKPPPTYISRLDSTKVKDKRLKMMIDTLPKTMPHSVAGYEIMEIPRETDDQPQGYITLGITGSSSTYDSLWVRIESIIDKWNECLE